MPPSPHHRLGAAIVGGLRAPVFQKAKAGKGMPVNIYTADDDDKARGIKRGDVIKILVNPMRKKPRRAGG